MIEINLRHQASHIRRSQFGRAAHQEGKLHRVGDLVGGFDFEQALTDAGQIGM